MSLIRLVVYNTPAAGHRRETASSHSPPVGHDADDAADACDLGELQCGAQSRERGRQCERCGVQTGNAAGRCSRNTVQSAL